MTVNLNFNLEAWIKQLQIDAASEEDAKQKLMHMTLEEIFSDDSLVADSDFKISEIEATCIEYDLVVQVSDIVYDLDEEEMDSAVIAYLNAFLPTKQTITLKAVSEEDDVEEFIKDRIWLDTAYPAKSFEFQVIEKK